MTAAAPWAHPTDKGAPPSPALDDLDALYEAYHRQALGVAYRIVSDASEAEEVVQEAFLAIWRAGHTYDPTRGSARTWLLTLVRNRAIDVMRTRQRRPVRPLDDALEAADATDVHAQATTNVDSEAASEAMGALPTEQREAVELAYFGGLSHGEIASRLDLPIGTVKGRIRLGLDRLRSALGVPRNPSARRA